MPVETSPPRRVHGLFKTTHSWLPVGQHFLARCHVLCPRNETLSQTETGRNPNSVKSYSDLNICSFFLFIHAYAVGEKMVLKNDNARHRDGQILFKSVRKYILLKLRNKQQRRIQFTIVPRYHWLCV